MESIGLSNKEASDSALKKFGTLILTVERVVSNLCIASKVPNAPILERLGSSSVDYQKTFRTIEVNRSESVESDLPVHVGVNLSTL